MSKDLIIVVLLAIAAVVCLIFFAFSLFEIIRQQINKRHNSAVLKISFSAILLLIVIAVISDQISAVNSFSCRGCHAVENTYSSWKKGSHKNVSCAKCHQNPGIAGSINFKIDELNNFFSWVSRSKSKSSSDISNDVCFSCHKKNKLDNTKNIKIRHSDFIDQYRCSFCHSKTGHQLSGKKDVQVMAQCFKCHKNKQVSNCSFCHKKGKNKKDINKVDFHKNHALADPTTCSGCHTKSYCVKCHGTEIPHSEFFGLVHAKKAKGPNKTKCLKCHQSKFCDDCHKLKMPHPKKYLPFHMTDAIRIGKKACYDCHFKEDCLLACHERHTHPGKIREDWLR